MMAAAHRVRRFDDLDALSRGAADDLAAIARAVRSISHDDSTLPRRHSSAISATGRSKRWSSATVGLPAPRMMSKPSASACMMPYSMPLWTILTKWPAPGGPQWR